MDFWFYISSFKCKTKIKMTVKTIFDSNQLWKITEVPINNDPSITGAKFEVFHCSAVRDGLIIVFIHPYPIRVRCEEYLAADQSS